MAFSPEDQKTFRQDRQGPSLRETAFGFKPPQQPAVNQMWYDADPAPIIDEERAVIEQERRGLTPIEQGLRSTSESFKAIIPSTEAVVRGVMGDEDGARQARDEAAVHLERSANLGYQNSLQDVMNGDASAMDWLAAGTASQLPIFASFAVSGGIGGFAGRMATRGLVNSTAARTLAARTAAARATGGQVAPLAAKHRAAQTALRGAMERRAKAERIGAFGGAFSAALGTHINDTAGFLDDPDANPDTTLQQRAGAALAGATIASAISTIAPAAVLKNMGLGATVQSSVSRQMAEKGLKRIAMGAGRAGVYEGSSEVLEEVVKNWSHTWVNDNIEMFSSEQLWRYAEGAVLGGLIGGAMGGATSIRLRDFGPAESEVMERRKNKEMDRFLNRNPAATQENQQARELFEGLDGDVKSQYGANEEDAFESFLHEFKFDKAKTLQLGSVVQSIAPQADLGQAGFFLRLLVDPEAAERATTPLEGGVSMESFARQYLTELVGPENVDTLINDGFDALVIAERTLLDIEQRALNEVSGDRSQNQAALSSWSTDVPVGQLRSGDLQQVSSIIDAELGRRFAATPNRFGVETTGSAVSDTGAEADVRAFGLENVPVEQVNRLRNSTTEELQADLDVLNSEVSVRQRNARKAENLRGLTNQRVGKVRLLEGNTPEQGPRPGPYSMGERLDVDMRELSEDRIEESPDNDFIYGTQDADTRVAFPFAEEAAQAGTGARYAGKSGRARVPLLGAYWKREGGTAEKSAEAVNKDRGADDFARVEPVGEALQKAGVMIDSPEFLQVANAVLAEETKGGKVNYEARGFADLGQFDATTVPQAVEFLNQFDVVITEELPPNISGREQRTFTEREVDEIIQTRDKVYSEGMGDVRRVINYKEENGRREPDETEPVRMNLITATQKMFNRIDDFQGRGGSKSAKEKSGAEFERTGQGSGAAQLENVARAWRTAVADLMDKGYTGFDELPLNTVVFINKGRGITIGELTDVKENRANAVEMSVPAIAKLQEEVDRYAEILNRIDHEGGGNRNRGKVQWQLTRAENKLKAAQEKFDKVNRNINNAVSELERISGHLDSLIFTEVRDESEIKNARDEFFEVFNEIRALKDPDVWDRIRLASYELAIAALNPEVIDTDTSLSLANIARRRVENAREAVYAKQLVIAANQLAARQPYKTNATAILREFTEAEISGRQDYVANDPFNTFEVFGEPVSINEYRQQELEAKHARATMLYDQAEDLDLLTKAMPNYDALPNPTPSKPTKTYAGVGSRQTPEPILKKMRSVAKELQKWGYTLNTGDAKGADQAFRDSATNKKVFTAKDANKLTRDVAKEIHPAPARLSEKALDLQARNTFQVFGENLDTPVDFVLVYAPPAQTGRVPTHALDRIYYGKGNPNNTGGTGQAIALASLKGIPVINMADPRWRPQLIEAIKRSGNSRLKRRTLEAPRARITDKKQVEKARKQIDEMREEAALLYGLTVDEVTYSNRIPINVSSLRTDEQRALADRSLMLNGPARVKKLRKEYAEKREERASKTGSIEIVAKGKGEFDGMRGPNGTHMLNTEPGKPGWLGNPHTWAGNDRTSSNTLDEVIDLFRRDFLEKIKNDPAFKKAVLNLRGKKVGYYKPNSEKNHLRVVQDYLNEDQARLTRELVQLEERADVIQAAMEEANARINNNPVAQKSLLQVYDDRIARLRDQYSQVVEEIKKKDTPKRRERLEAIKAEAEATKVAKAKAETEAKKSKIKPKKVQNTPVDVWLGDGSASYLSNLAARPFKDTKGRSYFSVEHAYQSWKSGAFDPETYNKFVGPETKVSGNKGTRTENDWNLRLMKNLMFRSFDQNPKIAQRLIDTGTTVFTHERGGGVWKEAFPRLLMEVRSELQVGPQSNVVVSKSDESGQQVLDFSKKREGPVRKPYIPKYKLPLVIQQGGGKKRFDDARLKRDVFRDKLKQIKNDLRYGGGQMRYIVDTRDPNKPDEVGVNYTYRPPSENPKWFQYMNEAHKTTTADVKKLIDAALAGKTLRWKQETLLKDMLDSISLERMGADLDANQPPMSFSEMKDHLKMMRRLTDPTKKITDSQRSSNVLDYKENVRKVVQHIKGKSDSAIRRAGVAKRDVAFFVSMMENYTRDGWVQRAQESLAKRAKTANEQEIQTLRKYWLILEKGNFEKAMADVAGVINDVGLRVPSQAEMSSMEMIDFMSEQDRAAVFALEELTARKKQPQVNRLDAAVKGVRDANTTKHLNEESTYLNDVVQQLNLENITFKVVGRAEADSLNGFSSDLDRYDGKAFSTINEKTGRIETAIWVNENITDPVERLSVMHHEFGHGIAHHFSYSMSERQAAKIIGEYGQWKAQAGRGTVRDAFRSRASLLNIINTRNGDMRAMQSLTESERAEILDFHEWFADQIGRWMDTNKRPQSAVEKFFKAIADKFKQLISITKKAGLPSKHVEQTLNYLWDSSRSHGAIRKTNLWSSFNENGTLSEVEGLENIKKAFDGQGEKSNFSFERQLSGAVIADTAPFTIEAFWGIRDYMVGKMTAKERNLIDRSLLSQSARRRMNYANKVMLEKGQPIPSDPHSQRAFAYMLWEAGHLEMKPAQSKIFEAISRFFHKITGLVREHEKAEQVLTAIRADTFGQRETLLQTEAPAGSFLEQEGYVLESAALQEIASWEALYSISQRATEISESDIDFIYKLLKKSHNIPERIRDMVATDMSNGVYDVEFLDQFMNASDFILNPEKQFAIVDVTGTAPHQNAARAVYNILAGLKGYVRNTALGKFFGGEAMRGRAAKNAAITQLQKLLYTDVMQEGGSEGFVNAKDRMTGTYSAEWTRVWESLSEKQQLELREVILGRETTDDQQVKRAAVRTRQFLKKMRNYYKSSGLPIGNMGKDYFPWSFDAEKFSQRSSSIIRAWTDERYREKWLALYNEHHSEEVNLVDFESDEQYHSYVKAYIASIANENGFTEGVAPDAGNVDTRPFVGAANTRELAFLADTEVAAPEHVKLLNSLFDDNVNTTMAKYISSMVKRTEYTKRFGAYNEKLKQLLAQARESGATKEDVELMQNMVKSATGRHGLEVATLWKTMAGPLNKMFSPIRDSNGLPFKTRNAAIKKQGELNIQADIVKVQGGYEIKRNITADPRKFRQNMGMVVVFQNWTKLALAALTNIADIAGIAFRTGDLRLAFRAYSWGIGKVVSDFNNRKMPKDQKRREMGYIYRLMEEMGMTAQAHVSEHLGLQYGSVFMEGRAKRWNDTLFRLNGMEYLTKVTRAMATVASLEFIAKHAEHAKAGDANSIEMLQQLGLEADDVDLTDDRRVSLLDMDEVNRLMKNGDDAAVSRDDKIKKALFRMVDESVLRPATWQRATWMNDPNWQIFSHLKGFMYTYHERVLRRIMGRLRQGDLMPLIMAASYVGVMMAADWLRDFIQWGPNGNPMKARWDLSDRVADGVHRSGTLGAYTVIPDMMKTQTYGRSVIAQMGGPVTSDIEKWLRVATGQGNFKTAAIRSTPASQVWYDPAANWGNWLMGDAMELRTEPEDFTNIPMVRTSWGLEL